MKCMKLPEFTLIYLNLPNYIYMCLSVPVPGLELTQNFCPLQVRFCKFFPHGSCSGYLNWPCPSTALGGGCGDFFFGGGEGNFHWIGPLGWFSHRLLIRAVLNHPSLDSGGVSLKRCVAVAFGCLHFKGTLMSLQRNFHGTSTTLPRHFHGTAKVQKNILSGLITALFKRFSVSFRRDFFLYNYKDNHKSNHKYKNIVIIRTHQEAELT